MFCQRTVRTRKFKNDIEVQFINTNSGAKFWDKNHETRKPRIYSILRFRNTHIWALLAIFDFWELSRASSLDIQKKLWFKVIFLYISNI